MLTHKTSFSTRHWPLAATRRRAEPSARPSPASEARPQRPTGRSLHELRSWGGGAASTSGAVAPLSRWTACLSQDQNSSVRWRRRAAAVMDFRDGACTPPPVARRIAERPSVPRAGLPSLHLTNEVREGSGPSVPRSGACGGPQSVGRCGRDFDCRRPGVPGEGYLRSGVERTPHGSWRLQVAAIGNAPTRRGGAGFAWGMSHRVGWRDAGRPGLGRGNCVYGL